MHTCWPAKIHRDSLSTASLHFRALSNIRVIVTSSSEVLLFYFIRNIKMKCRGHTCLPPDAIGEIISEWMVMDPSNGRSGCGFIIFDLGKVFLATESGHKPIFSLLSMRASTMTQVLITEKTFICRIPKSRRRRNSEDLITELQITRLVYEFLLFLFGVIVETSWIQCGQTLIPAR